MRAVTQDVATEGLPGSQEVDAEDLETFRNAESAAVASLRASGRSVNEIKALHNSMNPGTGPDYYDSFAQWSVAHATIGFENMTEAKRVYAQSGGRNLFRKPIEEDQQRRMAEFTPETDLADKLENIAHNGVRLATDLIVTAPTRAIGSLSDIASGGRMGGGTMIRAANALDAAMQERYPADPRLQGDFWWDAMPAGLMSLAMFIVAGHAAGARAVGALAATSGIGEVRGRLQPLIDDGTITRDEADMLANTAGAVGGFIQILTPLRVLRRMHQPAAAGLRQRFMQYANAGIENAANEALVNTAGEMFFNAAEMYAGGRRDLFEHLEQSVGVGGFTGWIAGLFAAFVQRRGMPRQPVTGDEIKAVISEADTEYANMLEEQRAIEQPADSTPFTEQDVAIELADVEAELRERGRMTDAEREAFLREREERIAVGRGIAQEIGEQRGQEQQARRQTEQQQAAQRTQQAREAAEADGPTTEPLLRPAEAQRLREAIEQREWARWGEQVARETAEQDARDAASAPGAVRADERFQWGAKRLRDLAEQRGVPTSRAKLSSEAERLRVLGRIRADEAIAGQIVEADPEAAATLVEKERPSRADFRRAGVDELMSANQRMAVANRVREMLGERTAPAEARRAETSRPAAAPPETRPQDQAQRTSAPPDTRRPEIQPTPLEGQTVSEASPDSTPAEAVVAKQPAPDAVASVKVMLTQADRRKLRELGYTAGDIRAMRPAEAQSIIDEQRRAPEPVAQQQPADATADAEAAESQTAEASDSRPETMAAPPLDDATRAVLEGITDELSKTGSTDKASEARAELRDAMDEFGKLLDGRLGMNQALDPQVLRAAGKVIAKAVKAGTYSFVDVVAELYRELVARFGDVRARELITAAAPAIENAWTIAKSQVANGSRMSDAASVVDSLKIQPVITRAADETSPPSMTSARKVDMDRDRESLGLDELDSPQRRSWHSLLGRANSDAGNSDRASRLAVSVLDSPRSLSDGETASIVVRAAELKNQHQAVMDQIGKSNNNAEIAEWSAEARQIEAEFDILSRALRASGTEKGRALAAQKLTIDRDYRLVSVLSRASARRGKALTDSQRQSFEQLASRLEAKDAEVQALERKVKNIIARRAVRSTREQRFGQPAPKKSIEQLYAKARDLLAAGCLKGA